MKTKNQNGFAALEAILIALVVAILAFVGYRYSQAHQTPKSTTVTTADKNQGYLVVKEWGLRFKIPSGLTDVRYVVKDDKAAFYAKPTGSDVEYRSDFAKFDENGPQFALGVLVRSTESSQNKAGDTVNGKKLGSYYYYTYWSFSGLATGAGATGLYYTTVCQKDPSTAGCDDLFKPEAAAFRLVNEDGGLLKSIELAK